MTRKVSSSTLMDGELSADQLETPHRLRLEAEELIRDRLEEREVPTIDQVERLLHELDVHRVELELQNEELRRSQQELMESRDRYADLYENAPLAYVTLDMKGHIQELNLMAIELLGMPRDRLVGFPLLILVDQEHVSAFLGHVRTCAEVGRRVTTELGPRH